MNTLRINLLRRLTIKMYYFGEQHDGSRHTYQSILTQLEHYTNLVVPDDKQKIKMLTQQLSRFCFGKDSRTKAADNSSLVPYLIAYFSHPEIGKLNPIQLKSGDFALDAIGALNEFISDQVIQHIFQPKDLVFFTHRSNQGPNINFAFEPNTNSVQLACPSEIEIQHKDGPHSDIYLGMLMPLSPPKLLSGVYRNTITGDVHSLLFSASTPIHECAFILFYHTNHKYNLSEYHISSTLLAKHPDNPVLANKMKNLF